MEFSAGSRGLMFRVENVTGVNIRAVTGKAYAYKKEVLLHEGAKYRITKVEDLLGTRPLVYLEEMP
jgi:hypothetical protein